MLKITKVSMVRILDINYTWNLCQCKQIMDRNVSVRCPVLSCLVWALYIQASEPAPRSQDWFNSILPPPTRKHARSLALQLFYI